MSRSDTSLAAATFFDRITAETARSSFARRRLAREQITPQQLPEAERAARAFADETERLSRNMHTEQRKSA